MDDFVRTLSDQERKRFRIYAYASTWLGCFSDVMLDSSAILILYFTMLGSSNSLTMFSTSFVGIAAVALMIPASGFVNKLGAKKVIEISSYIGTASFLIMAAAAFFGGNMAMYVALFACFTFCISKALWPVGWYLVLGSILLPGERAGFFSFMRFSYFGLTGVTFYLVGKLMGEHPPVWFLQIVIAVIGVMIMGRTYFVSKIRLPEHAGGKFNLGKTFRETVRNGSLVGFAIYVCFICFSFAPVLPLALIYMKNGLNMPSNTVQEISAIGIGGMVLGYFLYGRLVKSFGIRNVQMMVHAVYAIVPLGLFFCSRDVPNVAYVIGVLYFLGSFGFACFYCYLSQEILALSRSSNVSMASAFVQTYQFLGTAAGRGAMSILLGGMLAANWTGWEMTFSQFQTLFFFSAGLAIFCLVMVFALPSVIPVRDDHYMP